MTTGLSFDGKVVVVTGAAAGMGRSHALLLANRGAAVVVNDVAGAESVVAEIETRGGRAVAATYDISDPDEALALVEQGLGAYGRIDAIVNNAGISHHVPLADLTPDIFDRTMKVNAYGAFFVTHHAWPHLVASGAGRVVMVASRGAMVGAPNLTHYAASKGAMLGMTRQLAAEGAAAGVRVNAVNPAAFTEMSKATDGVAGEVRLRVRARIARQLGVDEADERLLAERSTAVISAVVAFLCHSDCMATGEFFETEAGRVNRISYASAAGYADASLTIEAVRDNFHAILELAELEAMPAINASGTERR
ncbi:SDR family NAD(P)-dependent oxidoreductase [Nocardioides sp. WS12]|uniref:SDR family NAD(P)-dependent oxidoreductase n=1 Tax=Nocardioides sp. WS12 TaxID=2486272 RepID=UPI0015FE5BDE|nr:SDR family NAD(P)-dependent oxidoreductase [Nocardioides sp. WS12]